MLDVASATLLVILSSTPRNHVTAAAPAQEQGRGFVAALNHPPALARSPRIPQGAPAAGDSLRNGALIGAAIGGVAGAFAGGTGCAAGSILSTHEETVDCTGPVVLGAALFGLLGAGIGAGVDAMLDHGPSPPGVPAGSRRGVRLHFRF